MGDDENSTVREVFARHERQARRRATPGRVVDDDEVRAAIEAAARRGEEPPDEDQVRTTYARPEMVEPDRRERSIAEGQEYADDNVRRVAGEGRRYAQERGGLRDEVSKKKREISRWPTIPAGVNPMSVQGRRMRRGGAKAGGGDSRSRKLLDREITIRKEHHDFDAMRQKAAADALRARDANAAQGGKPRRDGLAATGATGAGSAPGAGGGPGAKGSKGRGGDGSRPDGRRDPGKKAPDKGKGKGGKGSKRRLAEAAATAATGGVVTERRVKLIMYAAAGVAGVVMFLLLPMIFGAVVSAMMGMAQQSNQNSLAAGLIVSQEEAQQGGEADQTRQENSGGGDSEPDTGRDAGDSMPDGGGDSGRLYDSSGGGDSEVEGLSKRQLENASLILESLKDMDASEREKQVTFVVAWVESKYWNLANDGSGANGALKNDQSPEEIRKSVDNPQSDGLPSEHGFGHNGDHGSVGLFQQQVPWWGTVDELMDQKTSTRKFLEAYRKKKDQHDAMELHRAAQSVQGSIHGDGSNYRDGEATALKVLEEVERQGR